MGIVHAKVEPHFLVDFPEEQEVVVDEEVVRMAGHALNSVKARVDRVNIDGRKRMKDDVVKSTVDDLSIAKDFEDVIVRAQKIREMSNALIKPTIRNLFCASGDNRLSEWPWSQAKL